MSKDDWRQKVSSKEELINILRDNPPTSYSDLVNKLSFAAASSLEIGNKQSGLALMMALMAAEMANELTLKDLGR